MRSYQQAFGAGESKDFIIDAKYFFLFDANSAVTIQFWKGGAPSDDLALNMLSGFKCRPEKGFDRITITSSAAQTISFFVTKGEGDYDRFIGNVNLLSAAALDAATLNTIQNNAANYGASYKSSTILTGGTPETIFTPGANVNGAIVHSAQFWSNSAAAHLFVSLLAKASAPTTPLDGDVLQGIDGSAAASGNFSTFGSLKKPIRVPAGRGLYFISNLTEASGFRNALYTLL